MVFEHLEGLTPREVLGGLPGVGLGLGFFVDSGRRYGEFRNESFEEFGAAGGGTGEDDGIAESNH